MGVLTSKFYICVLEQACWFRRRVSSSVSRVCGLWGWCHCRVPLQSAAVSGMFAVELACQCRARAAAVRVPCVLWSCLLVLLQGAGAGCGCRVLLSSPSSYQSAVCTMMLECWCRCRGWLGDVYGLGPDGDDVFAVATKASACLPPFASFCYLGPMPASLAERIRNRTRQCAFSACIGAGR